MALLGSSVSSSLAIQTLASFQNNLIGWGNNTSQLVRNFTALSPVNTGPVTTLSGRAFNNCKALSTPIVANTHAQNQGDSAYLNGYSLYAWTDTINSASNPGVSYKIINQQTNQIVIPETLYTSNQIKSVRCLSTPNYLLFGYLDITNNNYNIKSFYTTDSSLSSSAFSYSFPTAQTGAFDWASYNILGNNKIFSAYVSRKSYG